MTPKGHGSLEVAVTYFMTPKGPRFEFVYDPKRSRGH